MSDVVILAIIGLIGTITTALISAFVYLRLGRVEMKVDGKMDKLLEASVGQAHAEGVHEGVQAEQIRTSDAQK